MVTLALICRVYSK